MLLSAGKVVIPVGFLVVEDSCWQPVGQGELGEVLVLLLGISSVFSLPVECGT